MLNAFCGKADRAIHENGPSLNPSDRAFDEGCELMTFFLLNGVPLLRSRVSQKESWRTVLPTGWPEQNRPG